MALVIKEEGKFTFVDGIYQGQKKPLKFGLVGPDKSFWHGPHFLAVTTAGSSLTLKALFDPEKSRLIEPDPNTFIAYLQVGQLLLNGIPFPLSLYEANLEVPTSGVFYRKGQDLTQQLFAWTDMPAQKLDGPANVLPFYAAWPLALVNTFAFQNTVRYPQDFGSSVVSTDKRKTNFYQVGYLNKTVSLGLGKFPSNYDTSLYLQNLDVSGMRINGTLPEVFTPQNMATKLEEIINAFLSFDSVPKPIELSGKRLLISPTRIYLRYKTQYLAKGRSSKFQTEDLHVLFFATDTGRVVWSFLDEDDFENEIDDKHVNGPVDLANIARAALTEGDSKFWLTNWNDEELTVAFELTTIACQVFINQDNTLLKMKLLEGFQWRAQRRFYRTKDADDIAFRVRDLDVFGSMAGLVKRAVTTDVQAQSQGRTSIEWIEPVFRLAFDQEDHPMSE